ncbi:MAG: universal stress protein [Anaerolineales bacterium]
MFQKIVLGIDGSEHALRAAKVAGELARSMNAQLIVVTAYDPIPSYIGEPNLQEAISARLHEANAILEKGVKEVGEVPAGVESEAIEGSAAEVVLDVARVRGADLIVVGSRGLGKLSGLLLGSQSQKIIQHATCPVLVVR